MPKGVHRSAPTAEIGADGHRPSPALDAAVDRPGLARVPEVEILRRVRAAHHGAGERGRSRRRADDAPPPCAERVRSLCDLDARCGTEPEADRVGHKAR